MPDLLKDRKAGLLYLTNSQTRQVFHSVIYQEIGHQNTAAPQQTKVEITSTYF